MAVRAIWATGPRDVHEEEGFTCQSQSQSGEEGESSSEELAVPRGALGVPAFLAVGSLLLLATLLLLVTARLGGRGDPAGGVVAEEAPRELVQFGFGAFAEALAGLAPFSGASDEPDAGMVYAIYTYGAPGTAGSALEDLQREDRSFRGLRSYTQDVLSPMTKQVDAAAISNAYLHARMPTAALGLGTDSKFEGGPGEPTWPNDVDGGTFMEWRLHWEDDYTPRLKHVTINGSRYLSREPFAAAYAFVILAYKAYDSTANTREAMAERLPGWKLVARETRIHGSGPDYDEDPVALVQNSITLDCVLVLTGTNCANEIGSSLDTVGTGFCGFSDVHEGYRDELWSLTKDLWPALRPKLSKCRKVSCVGHSLGGSLCELLAACANSGRLQDPDYRQQAWARGAPEAMTEISQGSIFYTDDAERRCDEPPCPKS